MKVSISPSFKSVSFQNPKLILQLPKLTAKSRRILKVCSKTQYARTRTLPTMPTTSECNWQESFRVSLSGGDTELLFEIYQQHAFGYNPEELMNVWSGRIPVQAYFGEIKQFDVFGADLQKVGSLWVRLKTFSDGIKLPEQRLTQAKAEEATIELGSKTQAVNTAAKLSTNRNETDLQQQYKQIVGASSMVSSNKSAGKQQTKATKNLAALLSSRAPSLESYQNRLQIYSMVGTQKLNLASLKGLDVGSRDAIVALELGEQTHVSSVTRNRGLEPVWIQNISLGVNEEEVLEVRLLFVNGNEEGEELASGTLNIKDVKERRHIVSKQVEMSTLDGHRKCGIIYFDVRYRGRQDLISPIKNQRLLYEAPVNRSFEIGSSRERARSHRPPGEDTTPHTERLDHSPGSYHRVKRSAVKGENGYIVFPKANRFQYWVNSRNPNISYIDPYAPNYNSFDFDEKKGHGKGPSIGYGGKHDFTKESRNNPGVGNYRLPSIWDKYDGSQP